MLSRSYETAKELIRENRDKLDRLVERLLKEDTVNRAEFVALMETGEVPEGLDSDKPRTTEQVLAEAKVSEQVRKEAEAAAEVTEETEAAEQAKEE